MTGHFEHGYMVEDPDEPGKHHMSWFYTDTKKFAEVLKLGFVLRYVPDPIICKTADEANAILQWGGWVHQACPGKGLVGTGGQSL